MHVRVRLFGKPDTIVVVESKLTKIEKFRRILNDKFDVAPKLQRLVYGGKLLEDGYTFHDYNIKLNDVIQLMVRIQQEERESSPQEDSEIKEDKKEKEYLDAESVLYAVGDLIDMRDREQGAWFEGKVLRIVHDPDAMVLDSSAIEDTHSSSEDSKQNFHKDNDLENMPPEVFKNKNSNAKKGIGKYFSISPKNRRKPTEKELAKDIKTDVNLLYKVQLDGDEEDSNLYCKLNDIRPRARTVIEIEDLKIGQKVMVNYHTDNPHETGHWYDFKVSEIKKLRKSYELIGTLYLGPEAVPQNDTNVRIHDKIFAIETVVPLTQRSEEYKKMMSSPPEKRSHPLNCLACRDDEEAPCKECGCYLCLGKEFPEKIILCDECNKGFHMTCLTPPMTDLPEEDWYCPSCKRDTNDVIAPGAAKQTKKAATKSNRDWGRGMACVGKTKTCAMPANHFGPIPGIDVGMCWRFRIQLSESGVHRPPVSGIHGRDVEGAYSIVLSGGYEDDVDNGNEFTYTGSGGRDLSGNKRTAEQSCDQTLTRENRALARNCAVKKISEEGGDAGDDWQNGKPVRVVRSYKMLKHFPKYAPKEGIRYDGIYKVVKYYPEKGLSGYRVWKYLLRRDDTAPAPWEPGAKAFPIIYPDGYLEAEAEKKAIKQKSLGTSKAAKKRALHESNHSSKSEDESSPPKKRKNNGEQQKSKGSSKKKPVSKSPKTGKGDVVSLFKSPKEKKPQSSDESALTSEDKEVVAADTLNAKLWEECLQVCENKGKKEFVEHVTQVFLCIICQGVAISPVTTPCLHNFCMGCLKQAFKSTKSQACPCCRQSLTSYEPVINEALTTALRRILAGYDAGKK